YTRARPRAPGRTARHAVAHRHEPQITDREQEPDPHHVMMEMNARDPELERAMRVAEAVDQRAGRTERDEEARRGERHALAPGIAKMTAVQGEESGRKHAKSLTDQRAPKRQDLSRL